MIDACVAELVAKGELSDAQARLYAETFRELKRSLDGSMSSAAAAARATDDTMQAMQSRILQRKRIAGLTYQNRKELVAGISRATDAGVPLTKAVQGLYAHDERMRGVSTLEGRYDSIRGEAQGMMAEMVSHHERRVGGRVTDDAGLIDVLREAKGETTGNARARSIADAWGQTSEYLRQRFNAAGGQIRKLQDWGMPQLHDGNRIFKAGFEQWRADILPRLNIARMVDWDSGLPLSGRRLHAMLKDAYEGIVSGGWDDRTLTARGRGALANARQHSRFLVFRDADAWMEYQAQYGIGDVRDNPTLIFETMVGHIDEMARDIAAMEIFGPNPNATHDWLKAMIEKGALTGSVAGADRPGLLSAATTTQRRLDNMWGTFTGEVNRPVNAALARGFSSVRLLETAARLGGATLTAFSDLAFSMATRLANGMPAWRALSDQIAWMLPGVKGAEREVAIQSGLIADELSARLSSTFRDVDEINAGSIAGRFSAGVLKASLLTRWTQAVKWAFGMEFMGHLGRQVAQGFAELPEAVRLTFQRYGIDAAQWDMIRSTPLHELNGTAYLRPDDIRLNESLPAEAREALAHRFLEMIQTETRYVSPEPNLRTRAAINQGTSRGTVPGEIMRSAMQFKGFPLSVMMMHGNRLLHGQTAVSRGQYAAVLGIMSTLFGAISLQAKDIVKGRDPRPMNDWKFWVAAIAQGGSLGLLGDFVYAGLTGSNRFGGSIISSALGPIAGTVEDLTRLTFGSVGEALDGGDTNLGRELVRTIKMNTPGSSIWYTRKALEGVLWDNLQRLVDPDFDRANARLMRRAEQEYGAGFWWEPGEMAPARGPDWDNAVAEVN